MSKFYEKCYVYNFFLLQILSSKLLLNLIRATTDINFLSTNNSAGVEAQINMLGHGPVRGQQAIRGDC